MEPSSQLLRSPSLSTWPIQINDAPIRCGCCEEPIVGSGEGPWSVLEAAVIEHMQECQG